MTSYTKDHPIPLKALAAIKPQFNPLRPLFKAGWPTVPLHRSHTVKTMQGKTIRLGKVPLESNWPSRRAQDEEQARISCEVSGHNTGIALGRKIGDQYLCAYDIDQQNLPNGLDDFLKLVPAIAKQLDVELEDLVIHQSGNDGLHIFFLSSEPDLQGHIEIDGIKVELKSKGQQVVAPGSVHPDSGRLYQIHPGSAKHEELPSAPQSLIEQFRKPSCTHTDNQIIPPSRLGWMAEQIALAVYDGIDVFEGYDDWIRGGMAFHSASGGEDYGLEAWIACSHEGEHDHCLHKWRSFGDGAVTEKTLNHYLANAGVKPSDAPKLTADEVAEYIAHDFADLSDDEIAAPKLKKPKRKLYSLNELVNLPEPEWLVDHAIPKNGLVVLYGPPKSAKTFLALDMALSMGSGQEQMHGFAMKPGRVLYVLAEGGASMMGNRARAWMQVKAVDEADLQVFPFGITLSSRKSVDELLDLAGTIWDLVVVDTLARCMDGDENSAKDMALAIKGGDYIREKTGAAVLLVHHSGKDQSKGLRGSTALLGAVDATIKMRPQGTMGGFELSVPELRHGEPPEPKWLRLQSTGDSAVLVAGTAPEKTKTGSAAEILEFIARMIADGTSRKEVADEIAIQFGFTDRTARRRIVNYIPSGKENAAQSDGMAIWREADITSSSPKAEVLRVQTTF
ncbi:MAG: AAA family ATPase [Gammaproteobacteria bacterium]|nr:AAA family ATPase [Gammaproteobacteria bacterium]